MTAPGYAPSRLRFQPQPEPERRAPVAPPRPAAHLRLVDPREARGRRLRRLVTGALVACTLAGLFAIVALRVVLAQGQAQVDLLEASVDDAQAANQSLRLDVAQLEAPSQIVAAARQRLGMVTPATVTYLTPPPAPAR